MARRPQSQRPKGAGAVMVAYAPQVLDGDDPQTALYRRLNYFPTPPWAVRAAAELVLRLDPGLWVCWEPACGEGHGVYALEAYFEHVFATDIHDHRSGWQAGRVLDFLNPLDIENDAPGGVDWIITNPPFAHAEAFVRQGLRRARRGVAVICRSGWFETLGREAFFYPPRRAGEGGFVGLSVEGAFFERVPMHLGRWEPAGDSATPYSVFVFLREDLTPPWLRELRAALGDASATVPIKVGTKARLTRPEDARLFGACAAMPLFEGVGCDGRAGISPADDSCAVGLGAGGGRAR